MFLTPSSWEIASLICKLFVYFGAASVAGGSLCLCVYSDRSRRSAGLNFNYMMLGSLLGFQAVVANFFIQVGLVNASGFSGMFDLSMASLLMDTALGESSLSRLFGFGVAFVSSFVFLRFLNTLSKPPERLFYHRVLGINVFALFALAFSFRIAGHTSVLSGVAQAAVVLHFMAVSAWLGSLYPLWQQTKSTDLKALQLSLKQFGNGAVLIVLSLLFAGVVLSWQLLNSFSELIDTAYGLLLVVKLLLVGVILALAALNKFYLVPRLVNTTSVISLGNSIRGEMLVALCILLVTSYFSSIIGPVGH